MSNKFEINNDWRKAPPLNALGKIPIKTPKQSFWSCLMGVLCNVFLKNKLKNTKWYD